MNFKETLSQSLSKCFLGFWVLYTLSLLLPRVYENSKLFYSIAISSVLFFLWFVFLTVLINKRKGPVLFKLDFRKNHYIQFLVQIALVAFFAFSWPPLVKQLPLIGIQFLFGYMLEMLFYSSLLKRYHLGFGPLPVIISINFFIWFKDDWFYYQMLLIALALLGKQIFYKHIDGKKIPVFNPSILSLAFFSVILIVTEKTAEWTWATSLASELYHPYNYLIVFVLGLVVQFYFKTTLVTFASVLSLYLLNQIYFAATGSYWFIDSNIPPAVFLGVHLLITDPSTSPKSNLGKVVFGLIYGSSIFVLFGILNFNNQPTLYDKILQVPLMNLMVIPLEKIFKAKVFIKISQSKSIWNSNIFHMSLWISFFCFCYGTGFLGTSHPGKNIGLWEKNCEENKPNGCKTLFQISHKYCLEDNGDYCNRMGVALKKYSNYKEADNKYKPILFYFEQACELGTVSGCLNFLNEYAFGNFSTKWNSAATAVLKKLENTPDNLEKEKINYVIASAYYNGKGVKKDSQKASFYFKKACDQNFIPACGKLGHMYFSGDISPTNLAEAVRLFTKACSMGDAPSCYFLGMMYYEGKGLPEDKARAGFLIDKSCKLGLGEACQFLEKP